jgi:hypothetical protein
MLSSFCLSPLASFISPSSLGFLLFPLPLSSCLLPLAFLLSTLVAFFAPLALHHRHIINTPITDIATTALNFGAPA